MDMVGHQHVRLDCTGVFDRRLTQLLQVLTVVDRRDKAGAAVVPSLHHVLRNSRQI
jgi:hypothetical protein